MGYEPNELPDCCASSGRGNFVGARGWFRDGEPIFAQAGDVELDGLFDQALHLGNGSTDYAHTGQIRHIGAKRGRSLFDDDQVIHVVILVLPASGCCSACLSVPLEMDDQRLSHGQVFLDVSVGGGFPPSQPPANRRPRASAEDLEPSSWRSVVPPAVSGSARGARRRCRSASWRMPFAAKSRALFRQARMKIWLVLRSCRKRPASPAPVARRNRCHCCEIRANRFTALRWPVSCSLRGHELCHCRRPSPI